MCKGGPTGVRRSDVPCVGGLEVAQAQWDLALRPSGARWAVPNAARGVRPRVDRRHALPPPRMGLEATGGLERAVTSAWATAGLPVVGGHPRQGRDCARATGPLAQTDAVDARALAPWAAVSRPTPRPLPAAQPQERRALLGRRPPLGGRRTAAQHRLAGTRRRRTQDIAAPIPWRKAGSATLDDARGTRLRASPLWREHAARLQRVKGIGPVCARTLRRALPAWGTRTRQQSAA
jgi:transposase